MTSIELLDAALQRGRECGAVRVRLRDGGAECEVWLAPDAAPEPVALEAAPPDSVEERIWRIIRGEEVQL